MQIVANLTTSISDASQFINTFPEIDNSQSNGLYSNDKAHHELYQKILDLPLDNVKAICPYSTKLARDNAWGFNYTQQVIFEYKRFLFLLVAAGHKVSPSDQIDQAWHSHMLYSHRYWEDFCNNTVKKQLHHWPSEGDKEFYDWYRMTINSYIRFFKKTPPENIWINPDVRYRTKTNFVRIDRQNNWIFPKPNLTRYIKKILENIGL